MTDVILKAPVHEEVPEVQAWLRECERILNTPERSKERSEKLLLNRLELMAYDTTVEVER